MFRLKAEATTKQEESGSNLLPVQVPPEGGSYTDSCSFRLQAEEEGTTCDSSRAPSSSVFSFSSLQLRAAPRASWCRGSIVDPAGVPIPGATVELIGGGKTVAKTVTAADGGFKFADVAAGTYDINVSLTGFRQTRATVVVGASAPRPLRYTLQIGSMSETVTVVEREKPRSSPAVS